MNQSALTVSRTRPPHTAAQLLLFETDDDRFSQTIDLYDIAPRFVFNQDHEPDSVKAPIRRQFEHHGKQYQLAIRPGSVTKADGSEAFVFPGEREQIIEKVIRRIAVQRARLGLENEEVVLRFTVNEVQQELKRVKHTFSDAEIKEALRTLHSCIVEIQRVDAAKNVKVLSSSAFPVLVIRQGLDDDQETMLTFSPLVTQAIKQLAFRQISYEWEMRLPTALSRWLYTRIYQGLVYADRSIRSISLYASEILRDSGTPRWKQERDAFRYVARTLDILVAEGVLKSVEREDVKRGRKIADALFHLDISDEFQKHLCLADERAEEGMRELVADAAEPGQATGRFQKLDAGEAHALRKRRQKAREALIDIGNG